MKKIIYYHRHGETYFSARNAPYGDKEHEALLTETGRKQVQMLGLELARRGPFDLYLTSPLPRAIQTASIVQNHLNMEMQVEPALVEGIREPADKIWERVDKLVQRLISSPQEKILLSTHGYICCVLAALFRGQTRREMSLVNPPTASFGWIELENGLPRRGCRFSTIHLSPISSETPVNRTALITSAR
ncbi:MAG TPA: phosphoglycerate mutase family protein [Chloroflexia bacterium]|nr:phosphoglycerate mutase family protein [Chloroflexia bacterium]